MRSRLKTELRKVQLEPLNILASHPEGLSLVQLYSKQWQLSPYTAPRLASFFGRMRELKAEGKVEERFIQERGLIWRLARSRAVKQERLGTKTGRAGAA
jgi:hypothetical protein